MGRAECVHGIPLRDDEIVAQIPQQGKKVDLYRNCLFILAQQTKQVMLK